MRLKLQFGPREPKREVTWHDTITKFPTLVLYKGSKWEFVMYDADPTGDADYICTFSEVQTFDPTYHITTYHNIEYLLNPGWGGACECGAVYTSFQNAHMFYCKKWTKW